MRIDFMGPAVSSVYESTVRQYRITLPTSTKVLTTTIAQENAAPDNFGPRKILTGKKPGSVNDSRSRRREIDYTPRIFCQYSHLF
jgi:hypothetical protein